MIELAVTATRVEIGAVVVVIVVSVTIGQTVVVTVRAGPKEVPVVVD